MFKFLVLSAIIAIAAAAPSGLYSHYESAPIAYQSVVSVEPEYHQVGAIVDHIPTAVSHQSRTDYHSKPIVKSIYTPVDYVQPIVHHEPIAYSLPSYSAYSTYAHSAPLIHSW